MTRVIHIDDLLDSDKRLLYAGRLVGYVYIGRTLNNVGPWGNRYTHKPSKVRGVVHVASAEEAILKFYRDLKGGADLRYGPWENVVRRVKAELAGKVLVCWCRRDNRPFGGELVCHGQLYAAIADDVAPEDIQ